MAMLRSRARCLVASLAMLSATGAQTCAAESAFSSATWRSYAITEALLIGRDGQSGRPLIVDGPTGATLLAGQDMPFPFAGGIRTFLGSRAPDDRGWELGYFGIYDQVAEAGMRLSGANFLQVPDPLGSDLTSEAQEATATWRSTINSAEFNLFRTRSAWTDRHEAWRTIDWLVGFRYVGVEESARLLVNSCSGDGPLVPYGVRTSSNMFGAQVGGRGRLDWQRWAVEGWAKAGLFGVARTEMQDPLVDWLGEPVPGRGTASSRSDGGAGFVGDVNLTVVRRINDVWGLRLGYNTLWIAGTALAPNQFSFAADGPVRSVADGGGIFLHGVNCGLEARW